ncbi:MAG: hypothetical protein VKL39_06705 [Leptolyngbyaceae bacterium]|nr:hypothetical protein [Leptolyngbyaceae bacterium]
MSHQTDGQRNVDPQLQTLGCNDAESPMGHEVPAAPGHDVKKCK